MLDLPPIVGDPAGMRALAGFLRSTAGQVGSFGSELVAVDKGMTFEGPAAEEFSARMQSFRSRCEGAAHELQGLAARLDTAAERVEAELRERERLLRERAAAAMAGS
jgi:uncharacterized protein YukE